MALSSDRVVSSYKSYKRPIVNQDYRQSIISELNCVDAVFINETPVADKERYIDMYKELNVNIITYGYKYSFKNELIEQATRNKTEHKEIKTVQIATTTQIIEDIISRYS